MPARSPPRRWGCRATPVNRHQQLVSPHRQPGCPLPRLITFIMFAMRSKCSPKIPAASVGFHYRSKLMLMKEMACRQLPAPAILVNDALWSLCMAMLLPAQPFRVSLWKTKGRCQPHEKCNYSSAKSQLNHSCFPVRSLVRALGTLRGSFLCHLEQGWHLAAAWLSPTTDRWRFGQGIEGKSGHQL